MALKQLTCRKSLKAGCRLVQLYTPVRSLKLAKEIGVCKLSGQSQSACSVRLPYLGSLLRKEGTASRTQNPAQRMNGLQGNGICVRKAQRSCLINGKHLDAITWPVSYLLARAGRERLCKKPAQRQSRSSKQKVADFSPAQQPVDHNGHDSSVQIAGSRKTACRYRRIPETSPAAIDRARARGSEEQLPVNCRYDQAFKFILCAYAAMAPRRARQGMNMTVHYHTAPRKVPHCTSSTASPALGRVVAYSIRCAACH